MEDKVCVKDCKRCSKLVETREQIVNGIGPIDAELLIVGEAPGKKEDIKGEPFVGRSGDLLDEELKQNNVDRDEVRITNTIRCRPKDNRDPRKSEINNCSSYLKNEISTVDPNAVLTLGKVPTQAILKDNSSVTEVAGSVQDTSFNGIDVVVVPSVHPAATMYDPSYKDLFEESVSKAVQVSLKDNENQR